MPNDERGRLDGAIDRAVRGMMHLDPRPGLRHRVAGRLADSDGRRSWWLPALAGAALCATVLISFGVFRSPQTQPKTEPKRAAVPHAPPASSPSEHQAVTSRPARAAVTTSPARRSPTRTIFGPERGRVTAANLERDSPDVGVDDPVALPMMPGRIAPLAPITIAPIQLQPIAIAPVTIRSRPDGR